MGKTLSQILAKNLEYYTSNPKKRCVGAKGQCKYSGKTLGIKTKGCFVGSLLPLKSRLLLDRNDNDLGVIGMVKYSNNMIPKIPLPKIITENIDMMSDFQNLHDGEHNWDDNGLNDDGKTALRNIIRDFNLDIEAFQNSL